MKNIFSSKEVMLVAWKDYKLSKHRAGNNTFSDSLKYAWDLLKNNFRSFCFELRLIVKAKRVQDLNNVDAMQMFRTMQNGFHSTFTPVGDWWGKYDSLFA